MADSAEALNLILKRRSIPSAFLTDPGPNHDAVRTLMTAAMRVPDHGKLTPWRFIILDRAARETVAPKLRQIRHAADPAITPEALDKADAAWLSAPVTILIVSTASQHPKIPLWEQELSLGASAMALLMAAHAMGYAGQWLTGLLSNSSEAASLVGARSDEAIRAIIHIGTPSAPPSERPRPAFEDKVTIGLPTA